MIYNELNFTDKLRIKHYRKKWRLFSVISRLFCMHFWKRNGIYGKVDIWTCCKCGKNYYQDLPWDSEPISYIGDDTNGL
jgi:hypothetical protein